MSLETLKKHFGCDISLIPLQKQVTEDIYKIIESRGLRPQHADFVAISTKNGVHHIVYYPFNEEGYYGVFKYSIADIEVSTNYEFKDLENLINKKIDEVLNNVESK